MSVDLRICFVGVVLLLNQYPVNRLLISVRKSLLKSLVPELRRY